MWVVVCFLLIVCAQAARKMAASLRVQPRAGRLRAITSALLATGLALAAGAVLSSMAGHRSDMIIGLIAACCSAAIALLTRTVAVIPGIEIYRAAHVALWSRLALWSRARRHAIATATTRFLSVVAPEWKHGLALPKMTLEGLTFRMMMFLLAVLFTLSPVFIAVAMMGSFGTEASPMSLFVPALLQYAMLLIAACWSVSLIATWVIILFLRLIGVIAWKLDVLRYAGTIAAVSGIGLVLGASVAVLLPVLASSTPLSLPSSEMRPIDGARPDLLLTATASGGVLGFLAGQLIAISTLFRTIPNAILGTFAAPTIFVSSSTALSLAGLNPGAMLDRITALLHERVVGVDPNATADAAAAAFRDDWRVILLFISDTAHGWFPDAFALILITFGCALSAALCALSWEFRRRVRSTT